MVTDITRLDQQELTALIQELFANPPAMDAWPFTEARRLRALHYSDHVYIRGLIEFTSFCKMDCYYCGLRRSNSKAVRYRMSIDDILACCANGYHLGLRTFVLQGGEDPFWTDRELCGLVEEIKTRYPDCALTLSVGERPAQSYRALYSAGADRFLLRHESASAAHYARLHPPAQTLDNRKRCLYSLKEAGFETGAGFMVGSPGQTAAHLAEDLLFLKALSPEMVGIGPFIPHQDTIFAKEPRGTLEQTLLMLALTRLMLPAVLLPATTALSSIHSDGRALGLQAGANVVMPNLSPKELRPAYNIYNGKVSVGAESAEGLRLLEQQIASAGFQMELCRGSHVSWSPRKP